MIIAEEASRQLPGWNVEAGPVKACCICGIAPSHHGFMLVDPDLEAIPAGCR